MAAEGGARAGSRKLPAALTFERRLATAGPENVAQKQLLLQIKPGTLGNTGGKASERGVSIGSRVLGGHPRSLLGSRMMGPPGLLQLGWLLGGVCPVCGGGPWWLTPPSLTPQFLGGLPNSVRGGGGTSWVPLAGVVCRSRHPCVLLGHPDVPLGRTAVMVAPSPGSASLIKDGSH